MPTVILTDEHGASLGLADQDEAHAAPGLLHKAFSVYLFRQQGREILIQRRSAGKRLWPLTWANSCCSHLRAGEEAVSAGQRRLREELGVACPLRELASFVYRAEDPQGRGVEYEYDTLLAGNLPEEVGPSPDPKEIAEWKWVSVADLQADMKRDPAAYAPWFHLGLPKVLAGRLVVSR